MNDNLTYVDRHGTKISLVHLSVGERNLVRKLIRQAKEHPDWDEFDCFWPQAIQKFYLARNVPGKVIIQTAVYQIAIDLSSRLGIVCGLVRSEDYLGDIEQIIHERFESVKRGFCKATGLSEDMLSHVLAGRKDFSMQSLAQALDKIGYVLRVLPKPATTLPVTPKASHMVDAKGSLAKKSKRKVG